MWHIVDIVLLARAVGKGLLPFHTQDLCSSYSSLTRSYIYGQSVGRNNLVVRFLKGSRRLNLPRPVTVPTWDLPRVLRALKSLLFEPLQSVDIRPLKDAKDALILALASVKRMGDQQALSVSPSCPSCLEFWPSDSKIVLKPRHGYLPKMLLNSECRLQLSRHFLLRSKTRG